MPIPSRQDAPDCVVMSPGDERWLSFITAHPDANIFHHPVWMDVIATCYDYQSFVITVCDAAGNITAGVPMMDASTVFRRRHWISLPFTDYCNPLYTDAASLERLTAGIASFYRAGAARTIELRWDLPPQPHMYTYSDFVLQTVPLEPDAAKVIKRFDRVHRQNARAAEEKGVRVVLGTEQEHLRLFYDMQLKTRLRHGAPAQPERFFDLFGEKIFKQGLGFVLLAYKDDKCLAGLVLLHWKNSLVAKYAASRVDSLKLRPNNLLFMHAIKWGCQNGVTVFDMGRSATEHTGLKRYKRGWGAQESPLTYSVFSAAPPRHSARRLAETVAHTIIEHSPIFVCRILGNRFYRYIG
ncbi:MAG: GNAT family N-acetyltransferase [Dehalococcoidales bacterium]|jgi:CelD/BcsL family acetyltransferase involved in cellulose biosynthesis